jgi:hypothetical protein
MYLLNAVEPNPSLTREFFSWKSEPTPVNVM